MHEGADMKPTEVMMWAGPLPPEDPFEKEEAAIETIFWAGPLPPVAWTFASRKERKVPLIGFAPARELEAKR